MAAWLAAFLAVVPDRSAGLVPGANIALACLPLVFGVRIFLVHGGTRITTLGLFNFACALFVGYSGADLATGTPELSSPHYITWAVLGAFVVQVLATTVARGHDGPPPDPPTADSAAAQWIARAGGLALILLLAIRLSGASAASPLLDGAAFTAVTLLATGVLCRERVSPVSGGVLLVVAGCAAYAELFHDGNGRLRIVALACTVAILYTARFPRRWIKVTLVSLTPLCVYWLAHDRLQYQEELRPGSSVGRNGLESMIEPMSTFAQVLQAQHLNEVGLGLGRSFLSIVFAVIPQSLTPSWAPAPIGYELVRITHPSRVGTDYSTAATLFGEWAFNFSLAGLALLVPLLAWALIVLDRRLRHATNTAGAGRRRLLWLALTVMLCGSIADLVWSGLHTFVARSVLRLPLLLVVAALVAARARPAGRDRT